MATKRIIFFTAGPTATPAELLAIGKLNAAQEQPYSVRVFNSKMSPNYGYGIAECDLVAGTIPEAYEEIDTIDPDNIPAADVPDGSAIVANAGTVAVRNSAGADSHNATAVVAGNTLTGVNLAATSAMVDNADVVSVRNSAAGDAHNATAVVANGVVTGVNLAATVAMVDTADALPLQNSAGTAKGTVAATVAAGAVSNVRTPATAAIVTNNEALVVPVTGTYATTATVTVAAGVITGIVLS